MEKPLRPRGGDFDEKDLSIEGDRCILPEKRRREKDHKTTPPTLRLSPKLVGRLAALDSELY